MFHVLTRWGTKTSCILSSNRRIIGSFNNFCSTPSNPDLELQHSFEGVWPRLQSLGVLFEKDGFQRFRHLHDLNILVPFVGTSLICYADLQNPLLKKYNFDAIDFLTGAKEAEKYVTDRVTTRNFVNYALAKTQSCTEADELQEVMHPLVFEHLCREIAQLHTPTNLPTITHELDDARLVGVRTYVIPHSDEVISPATAGSNGYYIASTMNYPQGAVIAEAVVDYQTKENWIYETDTEGSPPMMNRFFLTRMNYMACLSGHVPCEWKISRMTGGELRF